MLLPFFERLKSAEANSSGEERKVIDERREPLRLDEEEEEEEEETGVARLIRFVTD